MADEVALGALNGDIAESTAAEALLLRAERSYLGNLATIHYAGSVNYTRSNVLSVLAEGLLGYDTPTGTTGETSSAANTAYTDTKTQLTIAKYTKVYEPTDIIRMILGDIINPQALAMDAVATSANVLTNLIATAVASFTATAGPGSGVDADIPSLLAGIGKMETLNCDKTKGFTGVLHGQQWSDIYVDLGAAGGVIPFIIETGTILQLMGSGYKGKWLGVEWYSNNRVPTANTGADRAGGIWAYGGIAYGDGQYVAEDPVNQMVIGRNGMFERSRVAEAGMTKYVGHTMVGCSKVLEAGVCYQSDA